MSRRKRIYMGIATAFWVVCCVCVAFLSAVADRSSEDTISGETFSDVENASSISVSYEIGTVGKTNGTISVTPSTEGIDATVTAAYISCNGSTTYGAPTFKFQFYVKEGASASVAEITASAYSGNTLIKTVTDRATMTKPVELAFEGSAIASQQSFKIRFTVSLIVDKNIFFLPSWQKDSSAVIALADGNKYTIASHSVDATAHQITEFTQISVSAAQGYMFDGWSAKHESGVLKQLTVSNENTISLESLSLPGSWHISPKFRKADDQSEPFVVKGTDLKSFYLDEAIELVREQSSAIIVVARDTELVLANGSACEIPENVTLLVPFDVGNTLLTEKNMTATSGGVFGIGAKATYCTDSHYPYQLTHTLFRQLTMSPGTQLVVKGAISLGSKASQLLLGQDKEYGAIKMCTDSNITVANGGNLYVWGYILPESSTSFGTVTVENGGSVYETAIIMDYPGSGDNATDVLNAGAFPLRSYTLRSVEVPATFHCGSINKGFYCVFSMSTDVPGYLTFIGTEKDKPVFQLSEGTTVTKYYVSGRTYFEIRGDMQMNSLSIDLLLTTFDSSTTSGFVVPSDYIVSCLNGTIKLKDNIILAEGTKFTVAASCIVEADENIYILDSTEDGGAYVDSVSDLYGNAYTRVDQDAILNINGTVIAKKGFYTSASKASIISSEGTGVLDLRSASATTDVPVKWNKSEVQTIGFVSAYLQNADGTYTNTGVGGINIYTYTNGKWLCGKHIEVVEEAVEPGCESSGLSEGKHCSACNTVLVEQVEVPATGHSHTATVTAPTCTEQGYTTHTCHCGDSYKDTYVSATGHSIGWTNSGKVYTLTCVHGDMEEGFAVNVAYRLDNYIWLNATVTNTLGVDYSLEGAQCIGAYIIRQISAAEIPNALTLEVVYGTVEYPLDIGLAKYKEMITDPEDIALIDAMLLYGEAVEDRFGNGEDEVGNDNGVTVNGTGEKDPQLAQPTDLPGATTMDKPYGDNVTVTRVGMTIGFGNCIQFVYGFNLKGVDLSRVKEIGLLYSPYDADLDKQDELVAKESSYAYVLYQKAALSEDSGNLPNVGTPNPKPTNSVLTSLDDLADMLNENGCYLITYDMKYADYSKTYNYRPYVLYEDGTVAYGEQFAYSLATYIGNRLPQATEDTTEKHLLWATWNFKKAAEAWKP